MHDLMHYANECMKELDALGIKYAKDIRFRAYGRLTVTWGLAVRKKGKWTININKKLLNDSTDVKGLKTVIHHELLHTCEDGLGHLREWKRLKDIVNHAYGYDISTKSTSKQLGVKK